VNGSKSCLRGGHRRGQLRDIRADVLREVLKVAALSAALTVGRPGAALPDRLATRSPGTERSASSSRNHSLSGTTWVACFRSHVGDLNGSQ